MTTSLRRTRSTQTAWATTCEGSTSARTGGTLSGEREEEGERERERRREEGERAGRMKRGHPLLLKSLSSSERRVSNLGAMRGSAAGELVQYFREECAPEGQALEMRTIKVIRLTHLNSKGGGRA